MKEFKTLNFPNSQQGQKEKIKALREASAEDWKITSETITPGKFKGGKACCLFVIFAPCAFFAGHTEGEINVTLEREVTDRAADVVTTSQLGQ